VTDEDQRLERLYDYTKFHIGIYILAATTMITIAGTEDTSRFLNDLIKHPSALLAATATMLLAGAAGGVIISTCAIAANLEEVWERRIGPWGLRVMRGSSWAKLEHLAFWSSVGLFAAAVLWPA
jgi:hypothetical protein